QEELINGVGIRTDARNILHSMCVLKDRCLFREQGSHRLLSLGSAIRPKRLHSVEARANTFDVSIPILRHDAFDPVRVPGGNAIAYGCAIVLNINTEGL